MESLQDKRSIFYALLCKKADKRPTHHWRKLFYRQLQLSPCTVRQSGVQLAQPRANGHLPFPFFNYPHALGEGTSYTIMPVSPQPMEATMCVTVLALPYPTPQPKKFNLVHQTFSMWEGGVWRWDYCKYQHVCRIIWGYTHFWYWVLDIYCVLGIRYYIRY